LSNRRMYLEPEFAYVCINKIDAYLQ
jgi:hypothetical protein